MPRTNIVPQICKLKSLTLFCNFRLEKFLRKRSSFKMQILQILHVRIYCFDDLQQVVFDILLKIRRERLKLAPV